MKEVVPKLASARERGVLDRELEVLAGAVFYNLSRAEVLADDEDAHASTAPADELGDDLADDVG